MSEKLLREFFKIVEHYEKFNSLLASSNILDTLFSNLPNKDLILTNPLTGSFYTYTAIKLFENGYSVFLPQIDFISSKKLKAELELLGFEKESILFSSEKVDLHIPSVEEVLNNLSQKNQIVVTTYDSLYEPVISKNAFQKNLYNLEENSPITYDELIDLLESLNYNRQNFVETKGEYAIRGSIIDIYSYSHTNPVRIEFDGDNISSLRLFDADNQRSFTVIKNYSVYTSLESTQSIEKSTIIDFTKNPLLILNEYESERNQLPRESINAKIILQKEFFSDGAINFHAKNLPPINSNLEILLSEFRKLISDNFKIYVFAEQQSHAERLSDLLSEYSDFLQNHIDEGKIKIDVLPMREGFLLENPKLAFFTEHQIFNRPFFTTTKYTKKIKGISKHFLNTIKKGDYVVHSDYGIGRFEGLDKIKVKESPHEVMKIRYEDRDMVYVNINYLNKVKKYSSKDSIEPHLSKLGTTEWKNTKKKIKSKIQEAVRDLIMLYAERKSAQGFQFAKDTVWQKELEASFYYEDTPDQIKVTDEIKNDMESTSPMDRLICGDVGFGKTEVAVRAAFKSVMDSKQVAILVPTTILAEQHYNTFLDRLSKYPIEIKVLSRFIKKSKQKEILQKLERGETDILIGTHRILSNDIKFKDLGLLIIDEEHRFGVMAKEKIRKIKSNVDTLYLTATPIPRTLNMSLAGSRDISLIATPPPNRLPIITEISKFDIDKIREVILFELGRRGQIFFVHDRVASIEKIASYLRSKIPPARFCVAHGQMKPSALENVLHEFLNKKFDVLICTKIIESGLDIPNANTIVVNRADKFGLAELYQLRGRVGRANKQAYAYLLVPSLNSLTRDAVQRIQALEEFSELGSGFNLAMRDLEIRGAGNLLGTEQSGFIQSVGFEMYMKIMEEAVIELKEKEFAELFKIGDQLLSDKIETTLDVYFDYNIPSEYIEFQDERLFYYTKLFTIKNLMELDNVKFEIHDKYGEPPPSVINLFELAKLRYLGSKACFEKIEIGKEKVFLTFPNKEFSLYYEDYFPHILNYLNTIYSANAAKPSIRTSLPEGTPSERGKTIKIFEQKKSLKLQIMNSFHDYFEAMEYIKSFLNEVILEIEKLNADSKQALELKTLQMN